PPILLTEVQAGDRRLDPARGAVLGRGERTLRIAWASPTFLEPRKLRFRYRLAGLDEKEIESAANEARFAALPTGSYRFEVRALPSSLPGGAASARTAVFAFSVLPAWWERWWARGGALLLLALAVIAAIRLRTHALEADRRRLEQAVDERSAELAQAVRELEEASFTDPLTRVHNRRFLTSIIAADTAGAVRAHRAPAGLALGPPRRADLVVYLLDLDRFKAVNDRHGHHVGDLLLIEVARRLAQAVRQSDLLVRWGGEEFLVVARAAERGEAWQLALRILEAVGGGPCDLEGLALTITCSIGWAPFPWFTDAPEALSFEQVLTLADRALYIAKREGRDQAVGALPAGVETEVAGRFPGWFQQPLDEGEGSWVRLVRIRAGVSATDR
ncbi:MAG TPA: GGDEF domain-containing protein, partial [Thermoanaerobaculia bacterium]|nr:GGDEF domain-containing protein [Thermoanaerobaculia bacterium]